MTPEAQRTAIAEACGWTLAAGGVWRSPDNSHHDRLPDYLHDLNAMHEAEKLGGAVYIRVLARITSNEQWFGNWKPTDDLLLKLATATAAQRAEAFLRCLGRWAE